MDARGNSAGGGSDGSARSAIGSERRNEDRVHTPLSAVCGQSGGDSTADELSSLDLVAVLLIVNGGRDRLGHLKGGAWINWVEFP
jgi:hypothetical protein